MRALPTSLALLAAASCRNVPRDAPNTTPSDAAPVAESASPESKPRVTWKLEYVALPDTPFALEARGDPGRPWLLWEVLEWSPDADDDDPYALGDIEERDWIDLPIAQLAAKAPRVEVPPRSVWLLGPDGACKARVEQGAARLEHHFAGWEQVSVSFALSGCAGTAWAPVAIVGDLPEPGLRWSPVRPLQSSRLEAKYRDKIGGATPRVEVFFADPFVEVRYGEVDLDEGCAEWVSTELGVLRDDDLERWTCPTRWSGDDCSRYELLGTLGTAAEARLAVLIDTEYAPVVFSPADETFVPILPFIELYDEDARREASFTDLGPCETETEDGP